MSSGSERGSAEQPGLGGADPDADRGAVSRHEITIFSAPSDAPRVRSRADLVSAAFNPARLILLIIVAGEAEDHVAMRWIQPRAVTSNAKVHARPTT